MKCAASSYLPSVWVVRCCTIQLVRPSHFVIKITPVAILAILLIGFTHYEWQASNAFQICNDLINLDNNFTSRFQPLRMAVLYFFFEIYNCLINLDNNFTNRFQPLRMAVLQFFLKSTIIWSTSVRILSKPLFLFGFALVAFEMVYRVSVRVLVVYRYFPRIGIVSRKT